MRTSEQCLTRDRIASVTTDRQNSSNEPTLWLKGLHRELNAHHLWQLFEAHGRDCLQSDCWLLESSNIGPSLIIGEIVNSTAMRLVPQRLIVIQQVMPNGNDETFPLILGVHSRPTRSGKNPHRSSEY